MLKKYFATIGGVIVSLMCIQMCYADNFIKYYAGTDAKMRLYGLQQTPDGGYVVAGSASWGGSIGADLLVAKFDNSGNSLWQKNIGIVFSDTGYALQVCSDGGYVIAGYTYLSAGNMDIYIVKLDASGNVLWQKTIGESSIDIAYSIQETSDQGYIVAGITYLGGSGNMLLIKLDSQGDILWQKTYGKGTANYVRVTPDGGYILSGSGGKGFLLIRLDAGGNILWQKTYWDDKQQSAMSLDVAADGSYIIAGGVNRCVLMKLDSDGNIIWQKIFEDNTFAAFRSVHHAADGGYIAAGHIQLPGSYIFALLVKVDSEGNTIWQKTVGQGGFSWGARETSVLQASDGGYVVGGSSNSPVPYYFDFMLAKVDESGSLGNETCDYIQDVSLSVNDAFLDSQNISVSASNANLAVHSPAVNEGSLNIREGTICLEEKKNLPPVANAGPDQTVELSSCTGANATLDGSASSDPDGDALTYTWAENGTVIATGVNPTVTLSYGSHTITLTVDDGKGGTASDDVVVNIVDTTAPALSVTVNPNSLWPPNHKYVTVTTSITVSDACIETTTVALISATSSEPDNGLGDGDTVNDVVINADGTISLRAERSGKGSGRVYTITYQAADIGGNSTIATAAVTVPHNQ